MEDEHPKPGWSQHCGPSNTALLRELVIALPSLLLQAGTTNVSCMGWQVPGEGPFPAHQQQLKELGPSALCTVHGQAKTDNSGLADVGRREPRGSAAVDSMSCLILKLFQASEDP